MKKTTGGTLYLRGRTWWVKWQHDGQQFAKSTGETARRKAEVKARQIVGPYTLRDELASEAARQSKLQSLEVAVAAAIEDARPRLSIAAAWDAFVADQTRPRSGERTLADYQGAWSQFTRWLAKNRPDVATIEDLSPAVANEYTASLDGLTGRRFNGIRQALSLVVRTVTRAHSPAEVDPFKSIRRKPLDTVGHRPLTVEEMKSVYDAALGEMRPLLALGMLCGLRLGDACLLQWSTVDLTRGTISLVPSKTKSRSGKSVHLPMHPALVDLLGTTPPSSRRGDVLPETAARYRKDPAAVTKQVGTLFRAVGIETNGPSGRNRQRAAAVASYHSLRHSYVTALATAGLPLHEVRALVGHGSEAIQTIYLHANPQAARTAVLSLPALTETTVVVDPDADLRRSIVEAVATASKSQLAKAAKLFGIDEKKHKNCDEK